MRHNIIADIFFILIIKNDDNLVVDVISVEKNTTYTSLRKSNKRDVDGAC